MKTSLVRRSTLIAAALMFASSYALAATDTVNGEKLYNDNCQRCHDTSIHTRPDRIIFSKSALKKRVMFCESMAAAKWSEQQINDVVEYLNNAFYKFP